MSAPQREAKDAKVVTAAWSMWTLQELQRASGPILGPSVVALGTFDGVHIGHQRILAEACELAGRLSVSPVAFTFDRHPLQTLAPTRAPSQLTSFEEKMSLIQGCGVHHVVVIRFDDSFSALAPQRFVEDILQRALGARGVVVGYNFRFGRGAQGDSVTLEAAAKAFGFTLRIVPPVGLEGEHVSSTRIRQAVESGDVSHAARLLGRPYVLSGVVVAGEARGRTLGYPTANLAPSTGATIPKDGVYLARVQAGSEGRLHPALCVVSDKPSFGGSARSVECFLLEFDGDLYGASMAVTFCERLRDIVRFDTGAALAAQIGRDVEAARSYFAAL